MIFIVTEQLKNGLNTMDIFTSGIDMEDYESAKNHLREALSRNCPGFIISENTATTFKFSAQQSHGLHLYGTMPNKELSFI